MTRDHAPWNSLDLGFPRLWLAGELPAGPRFWYLFRLRFHERSQLHQGAMLSSELSIHLANADEQLQAHINVYDVWSRGLPMDQHIARRTGMALNQRATWYVGTIEGRVVTALAAQPIHVRLRGNHLVGIAIASVHTLADHRGRGFAPRLIAHAESVESQRGARISMLYSDIEPAYYSRMGYRLCPAHIGRSRVIAPEPETPERRLWRFDPGTSIGKMAKMFESYHAATALVVARDEDYWRHLIARGPDNEFYWVIEQKQIVGYARLAQEAQLLKLRDFAVRDGNPRHLESLFAQVIAMASKRGQAGAISWVPNDELCRRWFDIQPRTEEITMIKPLDSTIALDTECLAAADSIPEIEHV